MSNVNQVQDQAAKTLIYNLLQEVKKLNERVSEMEGKMIPIPTIGFHVNASESSPEIAFKSYRKYSGTHD